MRSVGPGGESHGAYGCGPRAGQTAPRKAKRDSEGRFRGESWPLGLDASGCGLGPCCLPLGHGPSVTALSVPPHFCQDSRAANVVVLALQHFARLWQRDLVSRATLQEALKWNFRRRPTCREAQILTLQHFNCHQGLFAHVFGHKVRWCCGVLPPPPDRPVALGPDHSRTGVV